MNYANSNWSLDTGFACRSAQPFLSSSPVLVVVLAHKLSWTLESFLFSLPFRPSLKFWPPRISTERAENQSPGRLPRCPPVQWPFSQQGRSQCREHPSPWKCTNNSARVDRKLTRYQTHRHAMTEKHKAGHRLGTPTASVLYRMRRLWHGHPHSAYNVSCFVTRETNNHLAPPGSAVVPSSSRLRRTKKNTLSRNTSDLPGPSCWGEVVGAERLCHDCHS